MGNMVITLNNDGSTPPPPPKKKKMCLPSIFDVFFFHGQMFF